jgi:ankyrin repeat protein
MSFKQLMNHCAKGFINMVNQFIQEDERGWTQFMRDCHHGRIDVVNQSIDAKADVNAQNSYGLTPLAIACKRGHIDVVNRLIDAKADVNAQNSEFSPLIAACEKGHVVNRLIDAKADVNARDSNGLTPLIVACAKGHIDVVNRLIDAKADVNARCNDGWTPLIVACAKGHIDVANRLLQSNDINIDIKKDARVRNIIICFKPHKNTDQNWFINATETHIDFLELYCEVTGKTHQVVIKRRTQTIVDVLDHVIIPDLVKIVNSYW